MTSQGTRLLLASLAFLCSVNAFLQPGSHLFFHDKKSKLPRISARLPTRQAMRGTLSLVSTAEDVARQDTKNTEGETEEERRARKMKMALELAKRAREGGNEKLGGSDQKQDDEKDKQTTSGIGGSWSGSATEVDSHKPKVGTWGLFERPADISKAYGGGRKVGVGGYVEPDDIARAKQNKTNSLLASYRKSVGVDRELEDKHQDEIKEGMRMHQLYMRSMAHTRAIQALENITQFTSFKSELGGKVYLNLALAYEAQGERVKAKATYTKLLNNGDAYISSKARELLFGFEAMEFLKVNATFSEEESKLMSFELTDYTQWTDRKYDTSYFDPEEAKKRRRQSARGAQSRIKTAQFAGASGGEYVFRSVPQVLGEGMPSEGRQECDVVIIGSGIAGLSCAAILSKYGYKVLVLESHYHAGGAAHSFDIKGKSGMYKFDSGPSLFSGLSVDDSEMVGNQRCVNPLKQVLDAVGEKVDCYNYDTWGVCLPEGDFPATVGSEPFQQDLLRLFPGDEGKEAVREWQKLQAYMTPLASASVALPPAAIRFDIGIVKTLFRYLPSMLKYPNVGQLIGPYSNVLDTVDLKNKFIRNWLDMLCFLLSGLPADGTITAEVAFMFAEWYRPGVKLDYPKGGSEGIINALVRGIEKHGGKVVLKQHVEQIMVENGKAIGVKVKGGDEIFARKAVVSNAALKSTLRLLPQDKIPASWRDSGEETPECPSFMHLHLGFSADKLKEVMGDKELQCHYMVVNDWERGVDSEQNLVLISIPSVLDPSMAPDGMHALHAYTPATEPYDLWKGLKRGSPEYDQFKEERSQVLWKAIERVIPDIRERCDVQMVGTPLTHERFLRRHRGSYGPAIKAGQQIFPGPGTPIKNLLLCGDSVFPGIGMPAVAASGMVAANSIGLETLGKHEKLLDEITV